MVLCAESVSRETPAVIGRLGQAHFVLKNLQIEKKNMRGQDQATKEESGDERWTEGD